MSKDLTFPNKHRSLTPKKESLKVFRRPPNVFVRKSRYLTLFMKQSEQGHSSPPYRQCLTNKQLL